MPPSTPTSPSSAPSSPEANRPEITQAIDAGQIHREALIRGIPRSTLMMVLMFVVGVGWAIYEVKKTRGYAPPESDRTHEALVDAGISLVSGNVRDRSKSQQELQKLLSEFNTSKSVEASADLSNPFILPDSLRVIEEKPPPEIAEEQTSPEQPEETPAPAAPAEVETPKWKHLHVESILIGPPPRALISGHLVRVGQLIGEWSVETILSDRVILKWKEERREIYRP